MKKLCLLACVLALSGCASNSNQKVVVTPPVAVSPVAVFAPDNHPDWKSINGTTWALQIPPSFEDETSALSDEQKQTIKASFTSKETHTMIVFGLDETKQSIDEYSKEFNAGVISAGGVIVDTRKSVPGKGMSGLDSIISLYIIEEKIFVAHFGAVANGKAYSLECISDNHPKELGPMCMSVMHTVKITTK
jgi:hypothetical protein